MYVIFIRIEDSLNLYFTLDVNRQILLCAKDPNARDASHHIASRIMGGRRRDRRGRRCAAAVTTVMAACVLGVVFGLGHREKWSARGGGKDREEASGETQPRDVCLYSPASMDRLRETLPRIASTWKGGISVAVLVDLGRSAETTVELARMTGEVEGDGNRVVVTAVEALEEYEGRFPVNFLRNVAREACVRELNARFVLTHDVDFEVFAPDVEAFLRDVSTTLAPGLKRALIVPAFELRSGWSARVNAKRDAILNARRQRMRGGGGFDGGGGGVEDATDIDAVASRVSNETSDSSMRLYESFVARDGEKIYNVSQLRPLNLTLPYSSRQRLRELVHVRGLANGFQVKYFPLPHAPTNYEKFWTDEDELEPYPFGSKARKHPYYYEPYLIVRASMSIPFDESFVTYGFNKISQAHELAAAGFEFSVLRSAWTVHTNTHRTRAMTNLEGEDLAKCFRHPARSNDFRIARIGHSCIPAFIRRMECAYGFTLNDLEFRGGKPPQDLLFRLESDENIVCFGGCVTDIERAPRTPGRVILRGGRFVGLQEGSEIRQRKRGLCERLEQNPV